MAWLSCTLKSGSLMPASTRGLYLAESFATQEGWIVREERIRWKDWLTQQGLGHPKSSDKGSSR
jgi:hypothetical protein